MEFSQLITERRSIKSYVPNHEIPAAELKAIFEEVILSPSSFNLQHWRFVAVTDPEVKTKLMAAAYNQPQVGACSVAFVVLGKLTAHEDAPQIFAGAPDKVKESMLPMIDNFYRDKPQLQRDEAIRGATLAAMTLMYAAKNRGYDTGPMIGFDPVAVAKLLNVTDDHVPVMMLVLGKRQDEPRPRDPRHPVSEVVKMNSFDGPGLGA